MSDGTKLPDKMERQTPPARTSGWNPIENLRREVNEVFDRLRGRIAPVGRNPYEVDLVQLRRFFSDVDPAVDVTENDDSYKISVELPGISKENIDVSIRNGYVTIRGKKEEDAESSQKDHFVSERRFGAFMRSFQIPQSIDEEKVQAKFENGVLTVVLPKSPEGRVGERKIQIESK